MKKLFFLSVVSLGLVACSALQLPPAFDWRGQNFDDYVRSHGIPDSKYTLSDGNTIYSFQTTCEYDSTQEEETRVTVGKNNLIQSISSSDECPSYYESPEYKRQEMERERQKQEEKLKEKRNDIAGELLNMGAEEIQRANMMIVETKAIYAGAKQKSGMPLSAEEEQQIKAAEEARQDFANWKKRHDELSAQLEALR